MKAIKLILSVLFLFPTAKGFCQVIEDANICTLNGSFANFTVDLSGETYVWQMKSPDSVNWTTITSSNSVNVYTNYNTPTLNIKKSSTLPVTGTLYRVIVNDGSNNFTSNEAKLIVNAIPISKTIMGASETCIGGDKTLTYGTGSVGDILWQSSTTGNLNDFYDIDGETKETFTATDLQETTWFRVMNTSGECAPAFSGAVKVLVNSLPVAGYIDGGDINVCKSSNSTLLTLYDYEGSIKWQRATDISSTVDNFVDINLAFSDSFRANSLTTTTYFRAVLSVRGCASETTESVAIIVDPVPVYELITGASSVCAGGSKELTYGAGSVGDILWQSSTTGILNDFYDIDGETELIYTATDLQETTWFRVMNSSGECAPVFSGAVKVVVNPLPVAGNIDGGDINVCKSSNSTVLTLYNSEGTIQWQKAAEIAGRFENITSANKVIYTASAANSLPTTYYRALVSSGVCISVTTDPVAITFDPTPVYKTISGASPACIGGSKVLVYGTGSVGVILWQSSTTGNLDDFYDIDGETKETFTATDLQEATWFRVMNTSGEVCAPAYSPAVKVVVENSTAGKIEGGNSIISKNSNAIELTLKDYTGAIQWQKAASLTGVFTNIPLSTSSTYITTGLTETTYFRTLVSNGDCSAVASDPVVVNVDAEFKVTAFPNPFETEFNLNLTSLSLDPIELKIYDMLGRLIENHQIKSSEINSMRIGTTYPPGFFTVLIKQGQQEVNLKVIKK